MTNITFENKVYKVYIPGNKSFSTYESLFVFLDSHRDQSFIFTTNTSRPLQRQLQDLIIENLNKMIDNEEYRLSIRECWDDYSYRDLGLNEGEEVFGIVSGLLTAPVNIKSYTK